jgi:hypothetical protein
MSDTPGEVGERHEAGQQDGAKLGVVLHPAIERQGVKERVQGHASPLLCDECSDLALVLGDDGEAPAQISQPAIIKGADLVGSNVEGGAPFDGEAFEA